MLKEPGFRKSSWNKEGRPPIIKEIVTVAPQMPGDSSKAVINPPVRFYDKPGFKQKKPDPKKMM